jgi:hypothetical protein
MGEQYLFNDFSITDASEEITVPFGGREIPFKIKHGLTLLERQKASDLSVKRSIDPNTGKISIVGIDDARFAVETIVMGVAEWPFVDASGKAVPISRENVMKLDPMLIDELAMRILNVRAQQVVALDPFEKPSAEVS